MNVLNLRGPEFLQLYLALLAAVTIGAILLRWYLRTPADDVPWPLPKYLPLELAYLSGGAKGAVDAAIAGLVQGGSILVDGATRRLSPIAKACPKATVLERVIFALAAKGTGKIDALRSAAKPSAQELSHRLRKDGLLLSAERASFVQLFSALPVLALLVLGIAKICVGISRNKPVEILVFLCVVTLAIAAALFFKRPLRSRRGDRALRKFKAQNVALLATASASARNLTDEDLMLAFALFGQTALAGASLSDLRLAMFPPSQSSGGSCGGSSCGGGSSCSGGGCGGGGCGGCGGG